MNKLLKLFALIVFIIFIFIGSQIGNRFSGKSKLQGEVARDFTLLSVSGEEKTFSQLRDGKRAIIFFWATWCPHCRRQLQELDQAQKSIFGQGIQIVAIDLEETSAQVRSYLEKNRIEMDVLLDPDSAVAGDYEIVGVPTFIFVDESGLIRKVLHALPENIEDVWGVDA